VDEQWLASIRSPLMLVNTARADLVDEVALIAALKSGVVTGYGADTLRDEFDPRTSVLLDEALAERVVVTLHAAAQIVGAIAAMGAAAVHDVLAVLDGQAPGHPGELVVSCARVRARRRGRR
jgi:D-3-phosphoglycerate dehydrogenase